MILKIIGMAFLGYCMYGMTIFTVQRTIMYPRKHIPVPGIGDSIGDTIQRIWLPVSGAKVEAWYVPVRNSPENQKRPAVIFAHGNGELIDYCVDEFLPYNDLGIDLLLVEYPGYGRSEGRPSQRSITETFVAAYDWLSSRPQIDSSRIVVHGRSVGGGAACALAAKRTVRALILQSTFTDAKIFARGYMVPGFLVRDRFKNREVVESFKGGVLIIHGRYDEMIAYDNGVQLSKAAQDGTLITYNCHHNDCPVDAEIYWSDITTFLEAHAIIDAHRAGD